jgi:electron transport complex protein RnfG
MRGGDGGRMVVAMGSIGLIAGSLLVLVYFWTLPAIDRNKAAALERAIFKVLPAARQTVAFTVDNGGLKPADDAAPAGTTYYAGYDESGRLAGAAIEAKGQGFQDTLHVLYGYSPDCECIVGFTVLESKETPGLGDKIETDPNFTANFQALDVRLNPDKAEILNPIVLVKPGQKTEPWQIDSITGATISSRAVANILHDSTAVSVPLLTHNLQVLNDGSPSDDTADIN